jgi:triose/dihydroxyacetone kinase / FAD-AMP lyase (cyclizing)
MQTKHFIDDPTHLVNTALQSLTLTNPSLSLDGYNKIIYRLPSETTVQPPRVSIISGGGSGHEPGFAGFVGKGLLTASVAGTIFASPSAEQVRRALLTHIPTEKGVMVLTMNYTGDVLNFGMAAEKAKAAGIPTEFFAIGDDVSVGRTKAGKVGRRGIAGSILVVKICGALAELGGSLAEVYDVAKQVAENIVSVGSSMERVHVPGRANPSPAEQIPPGEIELGMGIHNEPGVGRVKHALPQLVKLMLAQLLDPHDSERHFVNITSSDQVVLLMNNLGGVSTLELGGIIAEVCTQLKLTYQLSPVRVISGTFLTSLNGLGWSISLLKLADTRLGSGKSMLELLDLPTEAVGWAAPVRAATWDRRDPAQRQSAAFDPVVAATRNDTASSLKLDPDTACLVLRGGLDRIIAAEPDVTTYDTILGDGDCGIGLKRGAEAVLAGSCFSSDRPTDALAFVNKIITIVEDTMDGTSGAIYAIFLNALAHGLREQDNGRLTEVDVNVWARALASSLDALRKYTPAAPGDRTLMDSLVPFIETLSSTMDVEKAARASRKGAEETKAMKASLGRAVYVGSESNWMGRIPDPGAWGLAEFLDGVADAVTSLRKSEA